MAPVPLAAYRPAPPRPPARPERPWWRTLRGWGAAAGWAVIVAGLAFVVVLFVRGNAEAARRATETAEVAREEEYRRTVYGWIQDTSSTAPVPDRAGHPVPTSGRAKRMWVISRMLVDRAVREREILARHGVGEDRSPADWGPARYSAYVSSARAYPAVRAYLEGSAAAIAELERTSAAWMEERTAALARESGIPARAIRDLLPPDFAGVAPGRARRVDAMLEMHRHLVRVDPRVHHAGANRQLWEREDDSDRFEELLEKQNDAIAAADRGRVRKNAMERATLSRAIE
jgi:hypothetical protein